MNRLPQGLRRPASERDLALNFHQTGEIRLTLSGDYTNEELLVP